MGYDHVINPYLYPDVYPKMIPYFFKNFMATLLIFNGNNTLGITPTPISGIVSFHDSFCCQTWKT